LTPKAEWCRFKANSVSRVDRSGQGRTWTRARIDYRGSPPVRVSCFTFVAVRRGLTCAGPLVALLPYAGEDLMSNAVMTASELAEYLRVNEVTIYRLAQEGKLPGVKLGRKWRFKREAIDRLLESGQILDSEEEETAVSQ
jgi:excisionase family DNA binding protein